MTDLSMKVVVGIGNPGSEYDRTRHNVGFDVIDLLARADHIDLTGRRFDALVGGGLISDEHVLLVKPQTFVNNSGLVVRRVLDWWKLETDRLLVVCDDADLPLGKIRFRREGSSGGHKGLESIITHLGTEGFARLRVGIGRDADGDLVDHVLSRFSAAERKGMEETYIEAARGVTAWLVRGIDVCMNQFN